MDPYGDVLREFFRLLGRLWLAKIELELQLFAEALDRWLDELFARPTLDWRESLEEFFAAQEAEGRIVVPESRADLIEFLEGWAETVDWSFQFAEQSGVEPTDDDKARAVTDVPIQLAVGAAVDDGTRSDATIPLDSGSSRAVKVGTDASPAVSGEVASAESDAEDRPPVIFDVSGPSAKQVPAVIPPKPRLPADSRGRWLGGKKGDGVFQYNDSAVNRKAGIAGAKIRFKGGYIAEGGFPPEAYYGGSAKAATVTIKVVSGTDSAAANVAMRKKLGDPAWRRPLRYRWHHAGGPKSRTMELVDVKYHRAIAHKGPAAIPRAAQSGAPETRRRRATGRKAEGPHGRLAKGQRTTGKVAIGKEVGGTGGKGKGPIGKGAVARATAVVVVYLTAREALRAAGILQPEYRVLQEVTYYYVGNDGSVFIVRSSGWFSSAKREFIAGPRKGETEKLSKAEVDAYQKVAEAKFGKYVRGTLFREPRFIPGTDRKSLPLMEEIYGVPREVGWIDEEGVHRYEVPKPGRT